MEPAPEAFGEMLRRLRTAASLSQEDLAERAGLSVRGISDLERGVRQAPRPETLRLLVDALDLTPQDRLQLVAVAGNSPHKAGTLPVAAALPLAPGPLFGRREEQAALAALLLRPDIRLITVTGTGGAGKTHLAVATASEMRANFRDGAVFVDLSPVTDTTHVLPTVGSILLPEDASGHMPLARVIARLRDAHLLLVLDNCEQVLAAAPEISQVLAACPRLVILATSRAPLGIRGEQEWPLSPLPVPDPAHLPPLAELAHDPAVALFVARAQASLPQFTLTAENATAVVAICQQLDGLPLAIELAAARIKLLTPQELTARLSRRLPLLTGGQRDRPPRQQTLRDAIAWSYDLLSPTEQSLFRQIGVFAGGWTAEAAAAGQPRRRRLSPNSRRASKSWMASAPCWTGASFASINAGQRPGMRCWKPFGSTRLMPWRSVANWQPRDDITRPTSSDWLKRERMA